MSATPGYHSDFGGLWTDRTDAADEIERRRAANEITGGQAEQLRSWVEHGCIVLPGAVPAAAVDRFREDLDRAFASGDERLLIRPAADPHGYEPLRSGAATHGARVVDPYAYYPTARDLLLAEPIVAWLRLVFGDDPLLFQALSFDRGSPQRMHRDTAYVVVSSPLELAGAWVALEDVEQGAGELEYYEGSHRLPEDKFSGSYKHWNPERDGDAQHQEWADRLEEGATERQLPRRTFRPRKGDVLIWSADLVHGAAAPTSETLTRRSLVGHFCPRRVSPSWFGYRDDRSAVVPWNGGHYASEHYDVGRERSSATAAKTRRPSPDQVTAAAAAVEAAARAEEPAPVAAAPPEPDSAPTSAQEDAVRAAQPGSPVGERRTVRRRSGGLVGKIRGLLER